MPGSYTWRDGLSHAAFNANDQSSFSITESRRWRQWRGNVRWQLARWSWRTSALWLGQPPACRGGDLPGTRTSTLNNAKVAMERWERREDRLMAVWSIQSSLVNSKYKWVVYASDTFAITSFQPVAIGIHSVRQPVHERPYRKVAHFGCLLF